MTSIEARTKEVNEIVEDIKEIDEKIDEVNDEELDKEFDEENEENEEVAVDSGAGAENKLPFPRATITNLIRKNVSKGKQIKGTVKDEMNIWVDSLIEKITKKMDSQPYTFVNYDMLKEAIGPYEGMKNLNEQRVELLTKINSIKTQCDEVIAKIDSDAKSNTVSLNINNTDLPFPKATITNKIRQNLSPGKTIKGPVKRGLNVWLGGIVERVSKKMDSYNYPYIDRSMFKEAIEPYDTITEIELEKERIIQQMQSMKTICDILSLEIDRKFKL
ncbi:MAG: hypothetical protein GX950_01450 [Candidatus Diapherotrites archaeon]|jgi:hypothetical protein|uniref:Uncharacterized protein n=1 Tax=Candidatus Iainarchaeum sp. TaxID=3101447 RepID=A0A7K4BZ95_9ARCH|nr:hypothetical protein [Candidatus Diapherotrites archaeon]